MNKKDTAAFVIEYRTIHDELGIAMHHFLRVFEIGFIGALQDVIKLVALTDTQFDVDNIERHVDFEPFLTAYTKHHNYVHPVYNLAEAKGIYIEILRKIFKVLFKTLYIATRELRRSSTYCNYTIVKHHFVAAYLYLEVTVDYLPF